MGAGPGRADLISVRGLELLRAADVVIYDRLIAQELLHEIRADAERILAGKQAQCHRMSQAQINALLIKRVRAGKHIVRLKGGDAFIFGRGGEESLALAAMDLPFEVVPGISAALAAPAFAGIPITHRGLSSGFAVIAGHEDPTQSRIHDRLGGHGPHANANRPDGRAYRGEDVCCAHRTWTGPGYPGCGHQPWHHRPAAGGPLHSLWPAPGHGPGRHPRARSAHLRPCGCPP